MHVPPAESSTLARLKFLRTPRWIALEIAVIAFALACYFFLAPWQFSRSAEHDAQQAAIAAAVSADTVPVADLMRPGQPPPADARWRKVRATGHFQPEHQAYIRLRHDNAGNPAYEVVAPFITTNGIAVLVDRGYISYVAVQEDTVTLPPLPSGTVTITGRIQPDQVDPKHRPPVTTPDGRTAYTAAASTILSGEAGPVYGGYLQLTGHSPGVIEPIALPDGSDARPFFSYAIQWLSFGAIAIFGLGYFIYREFTDPVDGQIYVGDDRDDAGDDRDDAGEGGAVTDGTAAGGPATDDAVAGKRARFDKSQLYDSP